MKNIVVCILLLVSFSFSNSAGYLLLGYLAGSSGEDSSKSCQCAKCIEKENRTPEEKEANGKKNFKYFAIFISCTLFIFVVLPACYMVYSDNKSRAKCAKKGKCNE